MQPKATSRCAVERLTAKIGGKWKVPVLRMLCVENGPLRSGGLSFDLVTSPP